MSEDARPLIVAHAVDAPQRVVTPSRIARRRGFYRDVDGLSCAAPTRVRLAQAYSSGMALVGRLSSPSGALKTLLEGERWGAKDASGLIAPPRQSVGTQHRRVSWVLDAVEQVLAEHGKPMQAKAVHAAVEALLGQAVSWSSVKGTLADHVAGPSPRFVRVGRGRYRLLSSVSVES